MPQLLHDWLSAIHNWIVVTDFKIWYYLNCVWHNAFLDGVMPFIRNQFCWGPVYLFLLAFMAMNFGLRGWLWCVGFILCFAMGDFISASLIKPFLHRTRPCNDPRLEELVRLLVPRSSGYSFPSSHAANHFAMGTFTAITLNRRIKGIWPLPLVWAMIIAYAQVYVGVHFPFDVICGGALGIAIGVFVARLYHHRFHLLEVL